MLLCYLKQIIEKWKSYQLRRSSISQSPFSLDSSFVPHLNFSLYFISTTSPITPSFLKHISKYHINKPRFFHRSVSIHLYLHRTTGIVFTWKWKYSNKHLEYFIYKKKQGVVLMAFYQNDPITFYIFLTIYTPFWSEQIWYSKSKHLNQTPLPHLFLIFTLCFIYQNLRQVFYSYTQFCEINKRVLYQELTSANLMGSSLVQLISCGGSSLKISPMRWARALAWTLTSACMHLSVTANCFLTCRPRTRAWILTIPFNAFNARFAWQVFNNNYVVVDYVSSDYV